MVIVSTEQHTNTSSGYNIVLIPKHKCATTTTTTTTTTIIIIIM